MLQISLTGLIEEGLYECIFRPAHLRLSSNPKSLRGSERRLTLLADCVGLVKPKLKNTAGNVRGQVYLVHKKVWSLEIN